MCFVILYKWIPRILNLTCLQISGNTDSNSSLDGWLTCLVATVSSGRMAVKATTAKNFDFVILDNFFEMTKATAFFH